MQAYMDFMMKILYLVSNLRSAPLDAFFSLITRLGEETVFLILGLVVFWCIDKRRGSFLLITGLVGTVINQALKLMFKIPRPWVYDPSFEPVAGSKEAATGYSFPSGHTQNAIGTLGPLITTSKTKWVKITLAVLIALVAFSRVYLGVHTAADVLVSLFVGLLLIFVLYPIFSSEQRFNKFMPYVTVGSAFLSLLLVLFVFLCDNTGVDADNLHSAMKNSSTLLGCTLAMIPVYFIDRRFTNFKTEGAWYVQIIKLLVGFLIVLGIKSGLSAPLVALFSNEFIARGVRYFLIVIFAGVIWPMTFRRLSGLKIAALDNFACKIKYIFKK